jgi:cytochrome c oxidase subunit 3
MVLFLVSDVATFLAGFVYYAFIRVGTWPPSELPNLLSSLVLVNTLILLASSVTLHYGHEALEDGNRRGFIVGLGVTVLLGVVFLGGQALEYYEFVVEEGFALTSGAFGSAFYGLTGLHGLHVALGVVLLALLFVRALSGQFTASRDTSVRTVALYWHFVDAVWVFLVVVLYVGAVFG